MTVEWRNPPGNPYGSSIDYDDVAEQLKTRPGEWALVAQELSNSACEALKRRGCKVTRRKQPNGKFNIYASWPVDGF